MSFSVIVQLSSRLLLETELGRHYLGEIFLRPSNKVVHHLGLLKLIIRIVDMKEFLLREAENRRIIRLVLIILV